MADRWRWGKAGVRLTETEMAQRTAAHAARRAASNRLKAKRLAMAERRYLGGLLVPYAITAALDFEGLYGPEVDIACRAEEPEVDMWEAGLLYPTWKQVLALAKLTQRAPIVFTERREPVPFSQTSLRFHLPPEVAELDPPILRFTPEAIYARLGAIKPFGEEVAGGG